MSGGHTPGLWATDRFGSITGGVIRHYINGSGQDQIAIACGVQNDNGDQAANACLIASAPELLAECDRLKAANAELAEALEDVRSDLWLRVEAKHGAKAATNYPSIVKASAALANHNQGETK